MSHLSVRVGAVTLGVLTGAALAAAFSWALHSQSYNVWGAVIVIPIVIGMNLLLIWRVSRRSNETWLGPLLALALAAKLIGTLARYAVAYVVYNGAADAERYNLYAASHYQLWREGFIQWEWQGKQGTQYMELITTLFYTFIGPSPLAGFVVFASLAFWGQFLCYRAFRTALPTGDAKRYALLILFLPSMLYWPSSIGKESWLLLFVGVTALGGARFFSRQRGALVLLMAGAAGTAIVRPHMAVLLFGAIIVAQLFRPARQTSTGVLSKLGGVVVMAAAAAVLASEAASTLGIDDLSWQAVSETMDWAGGQTQQGGSAFTPVPIGTPWGVLAAAVTALFRPFPWEAGNIQMFGQSLEGLLLLGLTVKAWPRLRRLPKLARQWPYLLFALAFIALFIWAFSGFGNFGILARQRVLMMPFFLVFLALPPADQPLESEPSDREVTHARR